jgi:phosphoglycolate phosphatase
MPAISVPCRLLLDIDSLIFDLDGTLIDSVPEIARALNIALQDNGIERISTDQVKSFVGDGAPVLVQRALAFRQVQAVGMADRVLQALLATYEATFDHTTLYPGVVAALTALAPLPLGLCTNKPTRATMAVLDHFDLSRFFGAVVCGDTLPQRKPDPAPLLHAARLLGSRHPALVGDSAVDSATAAAAGVPFLWYPHGYANGAVAPAVTFDHFDDLGAALGRLRIGVT